MNRSIHRYWGESGVVERPPIDPKARYHSTSINYLGNLDLALVPL